MPRARKVRRADAARIQPKLRMFCNGSADVNAVRAEFASALTVESAALAKRVAPLPAESIAPVAHHRAPKKLARGKLKRVTDQVAVNVFVQLDDPTDTTPVRGQTAALQGLRTAHVKLSEIDRLAAQPGVLRVELGEPLTDPTPVVSSDHVSAPSADARRFGVDLAGRHQYGQDVLIGIIDVQGFDFAHEEFLDAAGNTRWVRIWDQGATSGTRPAGFHYGRELTAAQMNAALAASRAGGLAATLLEPQSQMDESSHGTHVSSIAAGNRGVARRAHIAGVLVSLPREDYDRRKTFYDSTRLAHAFDYLVQVAKDIGAKAVSINVSLGTNGHAHDGSSPICRWIDAALCEPGRAVCAATGNAGQERAERAGDIGYIMGRIHTSGTIPAAGLTADIEWVVVGNGIADVSENELELWYNPQDRFSVSVRPPGGDWIGPIRPYEFIENRQLSDRSFVSIYNELYHAANGCNVLSVYLSPFFSDEAVIGVRAGTWTVRIHGDEVRDGRFDGWIERDDPRRLGRNGTQEYWSFPSFFSERSNVDRSSISSLACGERLIAVANLDEPRERINITSSQGPTRDGRRKPDVAAPGTDIVAANGFAPGEPWVAMSGTSMASPFVCGVVGLMFAIQPRLTAAQVEGILRRTARPLPGADFTWRDDAGFGRIDPQRCLEEAAAVGTTRDVT